MNTDLEKVLTRTYEFNMRTKELTLKRDQLVTGTEIASSFHIMMLRSSSIHPIICSHIGEFETDQVLV